MSKLCCSPNPAATFLNISSSSSSIEEAFIYTLNGVLIKQVKAKNITKIEVNKLPIGIYVVNLTDSKNQKSAHKIIISD